MTNRWLKVLDQKPIPIFEHLLDEAARLLAAELRQWPLPIDELDAVTGATFEALLREAVTRPAPEVFREAFRLTGWDLRRDFDAIDDYWRNQRFLEAGLAAAHKPMVLFLARYVTEQLLALQESTAGRVRRAHLLDVLERIAARSA